MTTDAVSWVLAQRAARMSGDLRLSRSGNWKLTFAYGRAVHPVISTTATSASPTAPETGSIAWSVAYRRGVTTRTRSPRFGPITVTTLVTTDRGWTPSQAVDLLAQGYSIDRVTDLTGYDRRWVTAQYRRLRRS